MLVHVPIGQIDDNPFQKRQDYGDLAADIQQRGLLQIPRGRILDHNAQCITPEGSLSITELFDLRGYRVQLAFGHRRLRAFRHLSETAAGWNTMPVYIEALDDDAMLDAVWSENQHRSDINAIEQAELLAAKLERARADGGNQTTVAAEWRLDRSTIANKLRLLELPAEVQTAVRERRLSERQALALLGVKGFAQRLNGTEGVQWSAVKDLHYGSPPSPETFVALVVADPESYTSDRIRDYVGRASRHAGEDLPEPIALTPVEADGVVQPLCKGCPKRYDQYCLHRPCLVVKQRAIAERAARTAAEDLGLPYSDDPEHFKYFDRWDRKTTLRELHKANITENLVIGYSLDYDGGARLHDDGYNLANMWVDDARKTVVLGHRLGKPTAEELASLRSAPADEDAEGPGRSLVDFWNKMRQQTWAAREVRGQAAVRAVLHDGIVDDRVWRVLHTMFTWAGDWGRVTEVGQGEALQAMWDRMSTPLSDLERWVAFLTAAGLNPHAAESNDEPTRLREAVYDLVWAWYRTAGDYSRWRIASDVVALCDALDAHPNALLTDEARLAADWLRRARPEAEQLMTEKENS